MGTANRVTTELASGALTASCVTVRVVWQFVSHLLSITCHLHMYTHCVMCDSAGGLAVCQSPTVNHLSPTCVDMNEVGASQLVQA